ncbi:peptidoglycan DD-metalloendopeptidase family protein [Virgibacillus sp. JSM 102003]|uniref:peptidoglycan DD-metalloendopeptidase family protein n=1 Tax=Virgibacillus sp. JSM 102003 TaxID=1562108 RepID=UPI0035BF4F8B
MFKRKEKSVRNIPKRRSKFSMLKKVAITTCIGLSFTFTTAYADDNSDSLETIFHVYVDGKHIGKVSDKETVQDIIDAKVSKKSDEFANLSITVGEEVSLVSERVFDPTYNKDNVEKQLKKDLSAKAEAVQLKIADETVGFFKDKKTADKVLKSYKAKYVDKKVLEKLTDRQSDSNSKDKPNKKTDLAIGDSIITDVTLSEKVSFSDKKVKPEKVLNVKQGLKMLEKGTLEDKVHKVEKGDALSSIADEYDLSVEKLIELNDNLNKDAVLKIDQKIHVTDYQPFVDVIVNKEKVVEETIDYETEVKESDEMYKGDKKVKQEGQKGKKRVHYALEMKNGNIVNKETVTEKTTKDPVKEVIIKGTKVVPSRGTGELHWPAVGGNVTSNVGMRWGSMHKGMDIAQPSNRSILAADNGTVVSAGWDSGGYGNKIVINHNNGMKTIYAHLSSISVSPGQTVEKGSKIGVMGTTGNSTGVHLHFEVYKNGSLENPQKHL